MRSFIEAARTGDFLSEKRIRAYSGVAFAFYTLSTIGYLALMGARLSNGLPVGTDFVSFWVAAKSVYGGSAGVPYDPGAFHQAENEYFVGIPFLAFFYPPIFLLYIAPFGALDYYPALVIWIFSTLALSVYSTYRLVQKTRLAILIILAFPATFINIIHGQNAFLSAFLMGTGLMLLGRSQLISGILIGLLAYKPQFGILIPIALVSGGYWRAAASAAVTVCALFALSCAVFGFSVWSSFIDQIAFANATLQEGYVDWNKMISLYAMLRSAGVTNTASFFVQAGLFAIMASTVAWAWWRKKGHLETRIALLIVGSIIVTPFALIYDYFLVVTALTIVALRGLSTGFISYEKTLMFLVFCFPVFGAIFALMFIRLDAILLILFFAMISRRCIAEDDRPGDDTVLASA